MNKRKLPTDDQIKDNLNKLYEVRAEIDYELSRQKGLFGPQGAIGATGANGNGGPQLGGTRNGPQGPMLGNQLK